MTETQQAVKKSSGTARIVWGAVLLAWALIALLRLPLIGDGASLMGGVIAVLLLVGFGVLLLVTGLNRRRNR